MVNSQIKATTGCCHHPSRLPATSPSSCSHCFARSENRTRSKTAPKIQEEKRKKERKKQHKKANNSLPVQPEPSTANPTAAHFSIPLPPSHRSGSGGGEGGHRTPPCATGWGSTAELGIPPQPRSWQILGENEAKEETTHSSLHSFCLLRIIVFQAMENRRGDATTDA